jgi:hypothetical protein
MKGIKKSRLLSLLILFVSLCSIVYGFSIKTGDPGLGDRFIGAGTVGIFLLAMPVFLFTESRGKKLKDYMLTRENIEKMKERRNGERN